MGVKYTFLAGKKSLTEKTREKLMNLLEDLLVLSGETPDTKYTR